MAAPEPDPPAFRPLAPGNLFLGFLALGAVLLVLKFNGAGAPSQPGWMRSAVSGSTLGGVFGLAVLFFLLVVLGGRLNASEKAALAQVKAQSVDDARASALTAIENSGFFRARPASAPSDPSWPAPVQELFDLYDRVEFRFHSGADAFLTFDRVHVVRLNNCASAFSIGTFTPLQMIVAVDVPSGRAFVISKESTLAKNVAIETHRTLSYASLWHMVTYLTTRNQLTQLRRQGQRLGGRAEMTRPRGFPAGNRS